LNKSAVAISFLSNLNKLFSPIIDVISFAHPEGNSHDATQLNETNLIIKLAKKPADRVIGYLLLVSHKSMDALLVFFITDLGIES